MTQHEPHKDLNLEISDDTLYLKGSMTLRNVDAFLVLCKRLLSESKNRHLILNLGQLNELDSSGIAAIHYVLGQFKERSLDARVEDPQEEWTRQLEGFLHGNPKGEDIPKNKRGFFERIGFSARWVVKEYLISFLTLAADVSYWSLRALFSKRAFRKGEVTNQAVLMGVNAALIVGMMSFIIGLVLALQSASQLRSFGANIYIVDLTVIAMMSEMGPLITAIIVAGRSGSSIAAEISTMKVSSELDALKTMGLNPIRFVVVPKMHGGLLTMPFLVILADICGIFGGMIIAMAYLDISPVVFINRMKESLYLSDILFGVIKSLVFIYLIVLTGSYFGFRAEQGATGVGKVTTKAVVVSISLVILADSIMGLLFY